MYIYIYIYIYISGSYTCVLCTSGTWQVALVELTCRVNLSPSPLASLQITWQVTACQVNLKGDPPKITCASCPKKPLQGSGGGVQVYIYINRPFFGPKTRTRSSLFFFGSNFFRWKWCSWNYFAMFSTTRGQTSTWQCCCGVRGLSATICRQFVRRDMPVTINCLLLPLHSHVLLTLLSLWAECSWLFVPWKRCG